LLPDHLLSFNQGGVSSSDHYLANTNPHDVVSIVIDEQETAGSQEQKSGENLRQNSAQISDAGNQEQNHTDAEIQDDPPATSDGAGSGADPSTALDSASCSAAGNTGESSPAGARGSRRQAPPAQELPTESGVAQAESGVAEDPAAHPIQRPKTRSQSGISKPKTFTDGTTRYANYISTGEPSNLDEALMDPKWKHAMQEDIDALNKNGTWHLVPYKKGMNSLIASGFGK
jgi:hypothetical protein